VISLRELRRRTSRCREELTWWSRPGVGVDLELEWAGPASAQEFRVTLRLPFRALSYWRVWWR
jgi:hypothetical protein